MRPRPSLELAEAIKCRRLRQRLLRVGATPHALPPMDRVPLPRLQPGALILAFHQRGGAYQRYLVRPEGVAALRPLPVAALEELVVATRDELEHGALDGDRAARLLKLLSDQVLGGVGRALMQAERVLILPDGLLRLVPFQALDLAGEPLVARVPLSRAPCLALAGERGKGSGVALISPRYGGDKDHLAGARAEVARLAGRYPRARLLKGAEVTPGAVAALLALPLGVVHFAGHGLADLEPGATPELLLDAEGASLDLTRASARRCQTGLLVLAACSAGEAARFRDGQRRISPVSLSAALLAAGAGAVVAASWGTKDHLTAQLMDGFHASLARQGPAAALRKAQLNIRKRLTHAHPRLWAPYALYGGWRWRPDP